MLHAHTAQRRRRGELSWEDRCQTHGPISRHGTRAPRGHPELATPGAARKFAKSPHIRCQRQTGFKHSSEILVLGFFF